MYEYKKANMTRQEMVPLILEDIAKGHAPCIPGLTDEGPLTVYPLQTGEYFCRRNNHFYKMVRVDDKGEIL